MPEKTDIDINERKLTTKKRKALPSSSFCGPNRSFPCHDCNHVRFALSALGRYKGPGNKATIRACIYRKAREMNCFKTGKGAKKSSETESWDESMLDIQREADFMPAILTIVNNYNNQTVNPQQTFSDLITLCLTADISSTEMAEIVEVWYYMDVEKACDKLIEIITND